MNSKEIGIVTTTKKDRFAAYGISGIEHSAWSIVGIRYAWWVIIAATVLIELTKIHVSH